MIDRNATDPAARAASRVASVRVGAVRRAVAVPARTCASPATCSAAARIAAAFRVTDAAPVRGGPVPAPVAPGVPVGDRWAAVRAGRARVRVVPVAVGRAPALAVRAVRAGVVRVVDRRVPVAGRWARAPAVMAPERGVPAVRVAVAPGPEVRAVAVRAPRVATLVVAARRRVAGPHAVRRIGVRRAACPAWSASARRGVCPACTMTTTSDARRLAAG